MTLGIVLGCSTVPSIAVDRPESQPYNLAHETVHPPEHHENDDHHGDHHQGDDHHHESLEVPMGQPVPAIVLVVHPDAVRGWNLELQTTHFRFAPEQVNQANQPNVGHGHLYINGERISRVYGNWLHLPQLPPGRTEITVSLNANGHEALTYQGELIQDTVIVEVPD